MTLPDTDIIRRYVAQLTGSPDTRMCWRFLPESQAEKQRVAELERLGEFTQRNFDGSLADVLPHLLRYQRDGWGVFIVVNEGGKRDADINRVRALFIDADDVPQPDTFHAEPDFTVRRDAAHWHAYWLVSDCPVAEFAAAQRRLALHYGTDQAVINPSRVMRVPGTWHYKDPMQPRLMTFEPVRSGTSRTLAELLDGVPEAATLDLHPRRLASVRGEPVTRDNLLRLLIQLDPAVPYPQWRDIVAAIGATPLLGDDTGDRRWEIAIAWSRGDYWPAPVSRWDGPDAVERILTAMPPREGGVGFGTLVHLARQARRNRAHV